jgi:Ran GTPase-activating protein (RanGAP) involved in mRNA processing and transport
LLKTVKIKEPTQHKTVSKKMKKLVSMPKMQTPSSNNNKTPITFNYCNLYDNSYKYTMELKNNFKIIDDLLNAHQLESFERDLDTKIKSFQLMKKNFESSPKFIDKLRMYLRCEEVSPEKIILRNCEISSDRLYYLITKKYFDFGNIKHLNLANNNLGDVGGSYLLWLVSKFSTKIDYLNINNNKIGRQSCEILVDILQKNIVKLSSLSIGANKIGDKLFSEISIAISKNNYLNKLFVNDNDLGKISSFILGSILKYDKKLKLLDVSKNNFGDDNIGYMLKGLICNTSLETLMINDMGLTNKSLRVFETTLCINSTLRKLFLERNKINFKGWRLLSDILNKNKYIEYISLVGNNFENEHINYIIDQQRQIKIRSISKTDYFLQITSGTEEVNLYEYLD